MAAWTSPLHFSGARTDTKLHTAPLREDEQKCRLKEGGGVQSACSSDSRPDKMEVQTEDPVCGSLSLWDWLTPATVTSTATQTLDDGRSLHYWRSIQGQC